MIAETGALQRGRDDLIEPGAHPSFEWLGATAERRLQPVLLTVPHAGRFIPQCDRDRAIVPLAALASLSDPLVDSLAYDAARAGHDVLVAQLSRAHLDLNRAPGDVDAAACEGSPRRHGCPRVRGGIGLVPTRIAGVRALWARPLSRAELDRRLRTYHAPWHLTIATSLAERRARFGAAVLLDLHSCPSRSGVADIVIGNRHGASAGEGVTSLLEELVRGRGFSVARNRPYAGAYSLTRHAAPGRGIHAVQIEVRRDLYLTSDGTLGAGASRVSSLIVEMADAVSAHVADVAPLAAE